MIEREKSGDVVAGCTGPRVEYWVMQGLPHDGDPRYSMAEQLERGFDRLGAEGWRLACRVGGGNQYLVFWREVPDAGTAAEGEGGEEIGGEPGEAGAAAGGGRAVRGGGD
jgi:hypothetical protein